MKTAYQNFWDSVKAMLKGKCIASNGYTRKKKGGWNPVIQVFISGN